MPRVIWWSQGGMPFLMSEVPLYRYVATYVSAFRQPMENGYQIWNFAGKVCSPPGPCSKALWWS